MKKLNIFSCILTLVALSAFSTANAFEKLGKIELGPMEKPPLLKTGTVIHYLRDGKEYTSEVVEMNDKTYSGKGSNGCEFKILTAGFAPTLTWKNCVGSTGSHKITKSKGSPWPMTKKTKFSYRASGKNNKGSSWEVYRRCKIKGQVRVKVPAGEFDTYELKCSEKSGSRTYWMSPELGHAVAIKRKHTTQKKFSFFMELVKVENPS